MYVLLNRPLTLRCKNCHSIVGGRDSLAESFVLNVYELSIMSTNQMSEYCDTNNRFRDHSHDVEMIGSIVRGANHGDFAIERSSYDETGAPLFSYCIFGQFNRRGTLAMYSPASAPVINLNVGFQREDITSSGIDYDSDASTVDINVTSTVPYSVEVSDISDDENTDNEIDVSLRCIYVYDFFFFFFFIKFDFVVYFQYDNMSFSEDFFNDLVDGFPLLEENDALGVFDEFFANLADDFPIEVHDDYSEIIDDIVGENLPSEICDDYSEIINNIMDENLPSEIDEDFLSIFNDLQNIFN